MAENESEVSEVRVGLQVVRWVAESEKEAGGSDVGGWKWKWGSRLWGTWLKVKVKLQVVMCVAESESEVPGCEVGGYKEARLYYLYLSLYRIQFKTF